MADFNAKHTSWNCHQNNTNGKAIYNFINSSTVDIGINKNVNYIVKVEVMNELSSDHLPVIVELGNEKLETVDKTFLNYKLAEWDKFRSEITKNLVITS